MGDYDRRGAPPMKLWVGCGKLGVDGGITEEDLREAFEKCGRVSKCWVARQPSGFAFVEFEDDRDAEDALKMDGTDIKGEPIQVQQARNNRGGNESSRKPGDWLCPQCKVNNFARRDACFRCGTPKPRDAGFDDYGGRGGGGRGGYGGGYDDRRGGGGYDRYDDRRGGGGYDRYDDRRGGGYDDRRGGGYDDRRERRDRDDDRRERDDDRRDRHDDRVGQAADAPRDAPEGDRPRYEDRRDDRRYDRDADPEPRRD